MGYKQIIFLAVLLFASSINLPATGTQIDDNLIDGTIVLLCEELRQSPLDTPSIEPCCSTFLMDNASDPSSSIPEKELAPLDAKRDRMAKSKQPGRLSKLAPLSNSDSLPGDLLKSKRSAKPSGSLIVYIDAGSMVSDNQPQPGSNLQPSVDPPSRTAARTPHLAKNRPVHRPSGCYIFQIDKMVAPAGEPALSIDPRILPNYQLANDPYWQYYGDCDQWNIVFSNRVQLAVRPKISTQSGGGVDFFSFHAHLVKERMSQVTSVSIARVREGYRESIHPLLERWLDVHSELATLTGDSQARAGNTEHAAVLRPNEETNLMAGLFPIVARLVFKEVFESPLLYSPDHWLDQRIRFLEETCGHAWISYLVRKSIPMIERQQIEQKKQTQAEIRHVFATRINWLSFQLNRVAKAIDDSVDEPLELVVESDEPVRY